MRNFKIIFVLSVVLFNSQKNISQNPGDVSMEPPGSAEPTVEISGLLYQSEIY